MPDNAKFGMAFLRKKSDAKGDEIMPNWHYNARPGNPVPNTFLGAFRETT